MPTIFSIWAQEGAAQHSWAAAAAVHAAPHTGEQHLPQADDDPAPNDVQGDEDAAQRVDPPALAGQAGPHAAQNGGGIAHDVLQAAHSGPAGGAGDWPGASKQQGHPAHVSVILSKRHDAVAAVLQRHAVEVEEDLRRMHASCPLPPAARRRSRAAGACALTTVAPPRMLYYAAPKPLRAGHGVGQSAARNQPITRHEEVHVQPGQDACKAHAWSLTCPACWLRLEASSGAGLCTFGKAVVQVAGRALDDLQSGPARQARLSLDIRGERSVQKGLARTGS